MRRLRISIRATAVAVGLLACSAVPASADVETAAPDPLVPVPSPTVSSGGMGPMSTPMGGTFACNAAAVPVQAQPSGYVIGNCLNGVHLRRSEKSDLYNGQYWDGGYIFGSFARCGWINTSGSNQVSTLTENLCGSTVGLAASSYMVANNDATDESVHGSCSKHQRPDGSWRCTDGTAVQTVGTCHVFANYRPWASGQWAVEPVRVLPPGYTLKWRYMARYQLVDGSGTIMIMVRDPNYSAGMANWAFIPHYCLSGMPGLTTNIG